jgi:hypothetical protein
MVRAIAMILGLALAGGCSLLGGDDRPDRSCEDNNDCFRAQGETCDSETKTCVVEEDVDAGTAASEPADEPAGEDEAAAGGAR